MEKKMVSNSPQLHQLNIPPRCRRKEGRLTGMDENQSRFPLLKRIRRRQVLVRRRCELVRIRVENVVHLEFPVGDTAERHVGGVSREESEGEEVGRISYLVAFCSAHCSNWLLSLPCGGRRCEQRLEEASTSFSSQRLSNSFRSL